MIALGFTTTGVAAAQDAKRASAPSNDTAMPGMTVDKMDPNMPGMDMSGHGEAMMPAALG